MARFIVGAKPGEQVDHINGNTLDNRKANLRLCSNAQNAMNTKASKDNASGFKGVSHTKGIRRPWWAKIWTNGKGIFLGAYATAEEAARAYDAAAVEMFGEFARTNFPVPGREDRMKTAKDYAMHIKAGDDPVVVLQVAMSAAASSALERAAQDIRAAANSWRIYEHATAEQGFEVAIRELLTQARALIPPAAAPAAETGKAQHKADCPATHHDPFREDLCTCKPSPAQEEALDELAAVLRGKDEMGERLAKALGVPAGPLGRLVDAAIARIGVVETALLNLTVAARGLDDEVLVRAVDRAEVVIGLDKVLAAEAARAAPPEGEGK